MPDFTCLLIGQSDEVVETQSIEAGNSAEALARIEQMLRSRVGLTAIEVWHEGGEISGSPGRIYSVVPHR